MPVKTETLEKLWAPLVHTNFRGNSYGPIIGPYLFLGKFVWTNGPESFFKVSPYTGIGPWMALPSVLYFFQKTPSEKMDCILNSQQYIYVTYSESSKPAQIRTYLRETPQTPKQTCTNSCPQALVYKLRTGTNLHKPHVENTPAEDLLAAGGANSGRFGACWPM